MQLVLVHVFVKPKIDTTSPYCIFRCFSAFPGWFAGQFKWKQRGEQDYALKFNVYQTFYELLNSVTKKFIWVYCDVEQISGM